MNSNIHTYRNSPQVDRIMVALLCFLAVEGAFGGQIARRIVSENGEPILYPSYLKEYDGKLYFRANNLPTGNNTELWAFDGTVARLAADINPGPAGSLPTHLAVYANKLYFCANSGTGSKLWSYDAASGAVLAPGSSTAANLPEEMFAYGGNLYFRAARFGSPGNIGIELWKFDGINQTPLDLFAGAGSSYPQHLIEYNGQLYFNACGTTGQGTELWRYSGTGMPTEAARIYPNNGSSPEQFAVYNGQLFFSAYDGVHGRELWRFDGTTASLAADLVPGGQYSSSNPNNLKVYNGKLYFCATDEAHGYELWAFDGTKAEMVTEINPTPDPGNGDTFLMDSSPASLTVFDGLLYFSANDGAHGRELWSFDGTTARMVLDINPGQYGSEAAELTVFNNTLYFSADDGYVPGLNSLVPQVYALAMSPALTLEEALDAPVMWTTGSHPWLAQSDVTHDGLDASVSGQVHNADDSSWIKATNVMGPGTVSFWWKANASCGAWAEFRMYGSNGTYPLGNKLDAGTDWRWETCILGSGPQELMWLTQGNCDDPEQVTLWLDQVVIHGPGNESRPIFTTAPVEQTVPAGTNVVFKAVAAGYPVPVLQWRFEGVDLPGETNFTLNLNNVQAAQAGLYSVVASNALGSVTNAALLVVLPSEPVLLVQPTNLTATFGLTARFEVTAQGSAPLSYQWLFNDLELAGETASVLILNPVTANQAGVYSVRIKNAEGTVLSAEASLAVVRVAAWGTSGYGQGDVPAEAVDLVAVAAGAEHNLGLKKDGRVFLWGYTGWPGQWSGLPPEDLSGVVKIAAGGYHSLALRNDATVVAWGFNSSGQTNVPGDLNNVVAVAGGLRHSLALKNDGTIVAWGWEPYAQPTVAAGLSGMSAIAAGAYHNLALLSNGTVTAWGNPGEQNEVPAGLANVVSIAAGAGHSVALKSDGTIVTWGTNNFGQCDVPVEATNVIAISAGDHHTVALRADGNVLAWGDSRYGQTSVPEGLPPVAAVAGGRAHTVALLGAAPLTSAPELLPEYSSGAEFRTSFITVLGSTYYLETAASLPATDWTPVAVLFGNGSSKAFTEPTDISGVRFYRVRVE